MMTEDKGRSGPARREEKCLELLQPITIEAGTIFRQAAKERGGAGYVEIPVGFGKDFTGWLTVQLHADASLSGFFKPVVAA